ncbi:hypothetical protein QSJ19_19875 [Gordonia sp. ABSL11-1]|uniref:hypothetical protein n=1 Tax=Gordonia sp. ABSL11-1 TaxID=3053924 RepID=UPI002572CC7B|nr:hypothetical protein [Gordonia sp. ABSL11-1]MDL9947795.1 hypothetical protein [Gordonia sp. ABSL11-1]
MIPPGAGDDSREKGTGRGNATGREDEPGDSGPETGSTSLPAPPFAPELLADLHAGLLPRDVADHLWSHLDDDPDARSILAALDRTTERLRSTPPPARPVPPDVAARTRATLDRISAEVSAAGDDRVVALGGDRSNAGNLRRTHRTAWWAAGGVAVAAAIAVVVVISTGLLRTSDGESDPGRSDPAIQAQPSAPSTVDDLDAADRVTLLSVLGKQQFAPFPSAAALRECIAANGVPPSIAVLGTGPVTISGREGVVILFATGVAGRFDALVVGHDCATGNPATITRTVIGG